MDKKTACDIAFGVFVVSWFLTRHVFYMMVCWSIYSYAPVDMAPGCYLADSSSTTTHFIPASNTTDFAAHGGFEIWSNLLKAYTDRNGPICWNPSIRYYFLALLLILQVLCCIWFSFIVKIVYKVLQGTGADDIRSDDECSDDNDDEELEHDPTSTIFNLASTCAESGMSALPREEEVGVDALTFSRINGASHRRQVRRETSRSSGISIPGHADRKDLLGRIGCDKPS